MTIASEITRLQNDKACICAAIENKGVTVGAATLDDYASCIDAIEQGGGKFVDVLVIAGGGSGGSAGCYGYGGGGGAGGVIYQEHKFVEDSTNISVGKGGEWVCESFCGGIGVNGGDSCFGDIVTCGGGGGSGGDGCIQFSFGNSGGSGGGSYMCCGYLCSCYEACKECAKGVSGQGSDGGYAICTYMGGNGGGAGGSGTTGVCCSNQAYMAMARGGRGVCFDIEGETKCYAGGGGGAVACSYIQKGTDGGGDGGHYPTCCYAGCDATTCGSGGGGGAHTCGGGKGAGGLVIVRYKTDGSCGITEACGGYQYTCGDYTIHRFIGSGAFCIGCPQKIIDGVDFLLVGGGGGGNGFSAYNHGGGGAGGVILCTNMTIQGSYNIVIGKGGCGCYGCNGGNSLFGDIIAYGGGGGGNSGDVGKPGGSGGGGGGCNSNTRVAGGAGCSGQGCNGGSGYFYAGGGGGGAGAIGGNASQRCGGCGGDGIQTDISGDNLYYAGGGGGGGLRNYDCNAKGGLGGGGDGGSCNPDHQCGYDATYFGGGGGGSYCGTKGGDGYQGVFILRYPTACGYTLSGGTCYTCGNYTIHCFTSDGTLTIN